MNNLPTRFVCATRLALGLLAASPVSVFAQAQLVQPLVQAPDMSYLGSFELPKTDGSGTEEGKLTYGGSALGVNPATQTLFVGGHDWYSRLCEVQIPSVPGQAAALVQRCGDVTEGRLTQIDTEGLKFGSSLVWNGRLILSAYSTYDADGDANLSHFASGLNLAQPGDLQGPVQVGTAGGGFVGGYMGIIPEEWRALLGGPALTGQCCISIISRTSSGPSVSVFNPDDVGRVSPVPATMLVDYPLANPLAANTTQNVLFNNATSILGVAFPAGTRSVLFVGRHGIGPYCYGESAQCADPVQIYKGEHSYPYVHQVWAYDANDLLAVRLGQRAPSSVRPYATWRLPDVTTAGAGISGVTYDHVTRRLYITEKYEESPRVHVYAIGGGGAGVGVTSLPSAPQGLTGGAQGSLVSLSWSPPAGAPWLGYVLEAGSRPGAADLAQIPLGLATTVSSPVLPGRYYVRVRAYNAQPAAGPPSNEIVIDVGGSISVAASPQDFRVSVSVSGAMVALAWSPPANSIVNDYVLDVGTAPGTSNLVNAAPIGAVPSLSIPGVGPGSYFARVRARNAQGTSAPSNEAAFTVTPPVAPGMPTGFRASASNRTITLSWAAPQAGGAATSYVLEAGLTAGVSQVARDVGPVATVTIPDAPPGTYYVHLRAQNAAGPGPATAELRIVVP